MNYIEFEKRLKTCISLLAKFQKISRQTDPSAIEKKNLFVQKYKMRLKSIAVDLKQSGNEAMLSVWLRQVILNRPFGLSEKALKLLGKKVSDDLEKFFISKPVLPELTSKRKVNYVDRYLRKDEDPPTNPNENPLPKAERYYTREDLMEMLKTTKEKRMKNKKRKEALNELGSYIEKIRKVDPKVMERKISEIIMKKRK